MYKLFLLFTFFPFLSFSQDYNYRAYDKAVKYYNQHQYEKSKDLLSKLIDNFSEWKDPNLLMSTILLNENKIDSAVSYLLNIYNVNDPIGMKEIADIYYKHGLYEKALYYFDQPVLSDTDNDIARYSKNCQFAINSIQDSFDIESFNLGSAVNSSMSEYINTISIDGKKIFFTRRVDNNLGYSQEDFYVSELDTFGHWTSAIPLPFNTSINEGAISISSNGILYVYTACDRSNSFGGCDLYIREYSKSTGWSKEYNLGGNINTRYWESQPCFSVNNEYLYFVSNRPGGYGQSDIWRAKILDNKFTNVENLGDSINTKYQEMSPFLHPDNLTFYFASNGHIGMGDYDLFISRRTTSKGVWMSPANLGYPINTSKCENSLIVSRDGKTAYYSSDKEGFGNEDIFKFELPDHIQAIEIKPIELDILTKQIGEEIILKNVQFPHNSYVLSEDSFEELIVLISYLKKNPNLRIMIEGHTDNVGSAKQNITLSDKRAEVVYYYLLNNGISKDQLISYKGFGESIPISSNDNEYGRKMNRRTSFRIIQ